MSSRGTFFEHTDFQGASITVQADMPVMPAGWDNRVSSARISSPFAMFPEPNYGGVPLVINQDTPDFRSIHGTFDFNDLLSSIRFRSMHVKLNIIVGVYRHSLSHSFDNVREQIGRTNDAFGPYGIYFDPRRITVAPSVKNSISAERQMRILEDGYLRTDMINVLFFSGGMWRRDLWEYNVRGVRLDPSPGWAGSVGADLHDAPNFGGAVLTVTSNQPSLPASHAQNVKSIHLHTGTVCTVYEDVNFAGARHAFYNHARDLNDYGFMKDWWKIYGGHCCDWGHKLIRVSDPQACVLGQELGHWFGLAHRPGVGNIMSSQEPCTLDFDQAEACWSYIMNNPSDQALVEFLP
jgi:Beta/Gamma crystallin